MTGRVGRFIEIDHSRADVGFEIALEWGTSIGDWGEMSSANQYCELELARFAQVSETCVAYNCCSS